MIIPSVPSQCTDDLRRQLLIQALESLSSEQLSGEEDLKNATRFFFELYACDFRHKYSEIYTVMSVGPQEAMVQERCSCLTENLSEILNQRETGNEEYDSYLATLRNSKGFFKLLDHVDLEARRLSTTEARLSSANEALREANGHLQNAQNSLSKARKRLTKANRRVENLQKETVSILGIFAAVMLVFNGAIGFSTSALETLGPSPDTQSLVTICSLIGFVLVSSVSILLGFVWKITERHEGYTSVDSDGNLNTRSNELNHGKNALKHIEVFAIVVDLLLALVFVASIIGCIPTNTSTPTEDLNPIAVETA